ncbi:class I adenylate-forming enzyme family protein [Sulfitobacter aestuarii]|uniref:Class I adenylate-forming enzyme family protein n=1 Tax=Sulfitobacter aestuarii TaxID=2161676 RepID=A0ABW5U0B4_9RHOB
MGAETTFDWHEAARLFVETRPVSRPSSAQGSGFRLIRAVPSAESLPRLGEALMDQVPFCLYDGPSPRVDNLPPGNFCTLSGGSSGNAKVIRRSQMSWIASFMVNAALFGFTPRDRVALLGRLSHSLALYGLLEALHLGMDAHVLDGLSPGRQWAALERQRITILYLTPTQMRLICQAARGRVNEDLRLVICGGGMCDRATRSAMQRAFPSARLHEFYGAAETSFATITDLDTPDGSVGHPYPGVTLEIRDAHGSPIDGVGAVWVRSPYLFDGYAAGQSRDTLLDGGFVTVGEMGEIDARGNLWLRGRRSRMVTIADQNVFPEEVEQAILALPEVAACAVLPVADPLRGHRLVAIVEGVHDVELATRLQRHCRETLGALAAPHRVLFRESLPLLPSGKTDLRALARWLEEPV